MRKNTLKYFFSVEGKTERLYLTWLGNEINKSENRKCNVTFSIKETDNPNSFAKWVKTISPIHAYHITDTEEINEENLRRFKKEIDDMDYVVNNMKAKIKKYTLGYSNLSFELWLILHKIRLSMSFTKCDEYLPCLNKAFDKDCKSLKDFKREKDLKNIFPSLKILDVVKAIENAEIIMRQTQQKGYVLKEYKKHHYHTENPSLSVHLIIKKILKDVGLL